jgi:phage tail-like protein
MQDHDNLSSYLQHLPAVFQDQAVLGRFLLAFEAILSGLADAGQPGLEQTIAQVHRLFDPDQTDEEFLPWLASWVALSLRADWDVNTKRAFIREIVPLYKLRGTKAGLQRMLEIYTREQKVTIDDDFAAPAHFFQVALVLGEADPMRLQRQQEIARTIIEQEKPAHTFFALNVAVPTMRLVSLDLQKREEGRPALLILSGKTTRGNTVLGTTIGI